MSSENPEAGLKQLADFIVMQPKFWKHMQGCYDNYSQPLSTDWNLNWNKYKTRLLSTTPTSPFLDKTLVDIVSESHPEISAQAKSYLNRFELNSHFTGRALLIKSLLTVGESLEKSGRNIYDEILGLIAKTIAYWFGTNSAELMHSYRLCLIAANLVEKAAKDNPEDVTVLILSAVTQTWLGLCIWRKNQLTADVDLADIHEHDYFENPEKYKGADHGSSTDRIIPGVSSLTLADEAVMIRPLLKAIEIFQVLIQLEIVLKTLLDAVCPALVLMTNKILSGIVSCFGHSIYSAKSWYTTFALARMYDRKGTIIHAAAELLKITPDLDLPYVRLADHKLEELQGSKALKMNNSGMFILPLAKSIACYKIKKYQLGLKYLHTAFEFRQQPENSDCKHLCVGEAYVVLGLYKLLDTTNGLRFSMFPDSLKEMSPVGLISKGFKMIIGVSRAPNFISRGWSDLNYNLQLMAKCFQTGNMAITSLKDSGRMKEFRCHTADMIYFSQRMGFVSRSIEMMMPTAEIDWFCRRFDSCQLKIIAIDKMMRDGCPEDCLLPEDVYKAISEGLNIKTSTIKQLSEIPHLSWKLNQIILPEYHYPKGVPEVELGTTCLTVPSFLEHALHCCCYLCTHPSILSNALNSLNLQARFAMGSNNIMLTTKLLHLGKHHHQRSIFRLMCNMEKLTEDFDDKELNTVALFQHSYSAYFVKPRIVSINTQMECASPVELRFIANSMNNSLAASKLLGQETLSNKYTPIEIAMSAMLNTLSKTNLFSFSTSQNLLNPDSSASQSQGTLFPDEVYHVSTKMQQKNGNGNKSASPLKSPTGEEEKRVYLLK